MTEERFREYPLVALDDTVIGTVRTYHTSSGVFGTARVTKPGYGYEVGTTFPVGNVLDPKLTQYRLDTEAE